MAQFTTAQRAQYAKQGIAMKDGGYPIRNATDLENAYKDWIRTGRSSSVAAHIAARAKALGLPNPITEKESPAEDKGENEGKESYDSIIARHAVKAGK